jgi:predicted nucleic acid-binding protein
MKPAVLDASPLIILAKAGYLDFVPKLLSPVVIPHAVSVEINAGAADDAAVRFVAQSSWLSVVDLAPGLSPLATWRLGQGESEVLEYARHNPGTVAVLDDKAARRAARVLDIPLTGTLGVTVAAVRRKLLPSLSIAIDTLRECGLYLDPATVSRLLDNDIEEHS